MAIPSWTDIVAMGEPFTRARLAACRCVLDWTDGYGSLVDPNAGGFRRTEFFDFDAGDQKPQQADLGSWRPRLSDLPCLSVEPMPSTPNWQLNTQARTDYILAWRIWTARHLLWQGERLFRRSMTALWQCKPANPADGIVPLIKDDRVTGRWPKFAGPLMVEKTRCAGGAGHARVWTFPLSLEVNFTPTATNYLTVEDPEPAL